MQVVPDEEVVFRNDAGAELVSNAQRFVSRLAAGRFLGYLNGQKAAMIGQAGAHTNRPELVAVRDYDTRYAMYVLRLGSSRSRNRIWAGRPPARLSVQRPPPGASSTSPSRT